MPDPADPDFLLRLEKAVAGLPRREREIFLAHRLDGMSYEEIAERTGLSVPRVERHLARALHRLDRALHRPSPRWWERIFNRC